MRRPRSPSPRPRQETVGGRDQHRNRGNKNDKTLRSVSSNGSISTPYTPIFVSFDFLFDGMSVVENEALCEKLFHDKWPRLPLSRPRPRQTTATVAVTAATATSTAAADNRGGRGQRDNGRGQGRCRQPRRPRSPRQRPRLPRSRPHKTTKRFAVSHSTVRFRRRIHHSS